MSSTATNPPTSAQRTVRTVPGFAIPVARLVQGGAHSQLVLPLPAPSHVLDIEERHHLALADNPELIHIAYAQAEGTLRVPYQDGSAVFIKYESEVSPLSVTYVL